MDKAFQQFVQWLKIENRQAIRYKRKVKYELSTERLKVLVQLYFNNFNESDLIQTIEVKSADFDDLLFLLRYHFRLWITVENLQITIYKNFPTRFKIIKEVNKSNHWFTPKTYKIGQILYFNNNGYNSANWLIGIPLAENLTPVEGTNIIATTQINYDFIEVFLD